MYVIIFLISVSLIVAIGFLIAFLWAVKTGQFEDRFTPSIRMLTDDNKNVNSKDKKKQNEGS